MSDVSHAHAVFLEITFGINTVFAIYKELREYITEWFANMVDQYVADIKGIETSEEENRERVNHVAGLLEAIAVTHLNFQNGLFRPVGWFAVAFALSAASILYFDWVDDVRYWCGILFLLSTASNLRNHASGKLRYFPNSRPKAGERLPDFQ